MSKIDDYLYQWPRKTTNEIWVRLPLLSFVAAAAVVIVPVPACTMMVMNKWGPGHAMKNVSNLSRSPPWPLRRIVRRKVLLMGPPFPWMRSETEMAGFHVLKTHAAPA